MSSVASSFGRTVAALLLCAAPAVAQTALPPLDADWPAAPQPSTRYVRLGATYASFGQGMLLHPTPGVDAAVGSLGAEALAFRWYHAVNPTWYMRRFGWQTNYAYSRTRTQIYGGVEAHQGIGLHLLNVAAAPTKRFGTMDRAALSVLAGGGVLAARRDGGPGMADSGAVARPLAVLGAEFRMAVGSRTHLTFSAKDMITWMKHGDLTAGRAGRTGPEHTLMLSVGLSFHEARVRIAPFTLDQLPRADRPSADPLAEPLIPSVPRLIGHTDGEVELGQIQGSGAYLGPQQMIVYFADSSAAVGTSDILRLKRIAHLLAETPGTVVILRGFDAAGESRTANQRLGEARANAMRDILLSYVPGVNPQRVSVVAYGADDSLTDPTKARRVELQYFR